jgi:hypothetical protein
MLRKHACDILNIDRKWLCLISRRYLSQSRRFLRQTLARSASKSWMTTANTAHRLRRRDKSAADCCSDSSLLRLHARSPAVVSLPSRVDIPVMLHALFCAMLDNLLGRVLTSLSNDSHKFSVPGDLNLLATAFRSSPKNTIFRRSPSSAQKQKPKS